ncbi:MAG: hypothetical protein ACQXXJ_09230 [Candidatus Bathyarchaeia archaeon]
MKLPKRHLSTATGAICVIIALAFFVIFIVDLSNQKSNLQSGLLELYTINAPTYLSINPSYSNGTSKITKIYLQQATLWFDSTLGSSMSKEFQVNHDAFLFIINGTVRNDYSPEEIITSSLQGVNYCTIGLDFRLYDAEGNLVNALTQGTPLRGFELKVSGSEEITFEAPFVTTTKNVAYFEIVISYLDPITLS